MIQMYLIASSEELPLGTAFELKLKNGKSVNIDIIELFVEERKPASGKAGQEILSSFQEADKPITSTKKGKKEHRIKEERLQKKIGTSLDGYTILEYLGRDKIMDTFKALQASSNQEVALEFLTSMPYKIETALKLAELLKEYEHPNLLRVYGSGYDKGLRKHYLVRELLEPRSLKQMIEEGAAFSLERALKYCMQIAKGTEALHLKGIIYLNVNPEHIFVTAEDLIKIGFSFFERHPSIKKESDSLLVGTPLFMSPEQCVGSDLDLRSDIYGIGILFYKLITGKYPFTGENSFDILEKHITEVPVPPSQLRAEIPPVITEIVLKMLQKIPSERFQNCAEIIEKLGAFTK